MAVSGCFSRLAQTARTTCSGGTGPVSYLQAAARLASKRKCNLTGCLDGALTWSAPTS